MNIIDSGSKGGCFISLFSSCRQPKQTKTVIFEQNKLEQTNGESMADNYSTHEEDLRGSIVSQYENSSFMSKDFFEDSRDMQSTTYESKRKRRKRDKK